MKTPIILLSFIVYSFSAYPQANNYSCCIQNIVYTSASTLEFDVVIYWTGTNTQKLNFFQAGINFNYAGMANGGIITGSFKPGSAHPSLPSVQQSPNWNINSSSKQIRLQAAISTAANAVAIPPSPGFRLGTFVISNTVPFSGTASPNFQWSFLTGTGTTTKTQVSCFINGATTGMDITMPANHCVIGNINPCGAPCPTVDPGGPYITCGDVHLNGVVQNGYPNTNSWSSSGTGTFDPNNTTLNATYHPSAADLTAGSVTLTLTNSGVPICSCPPISNSVVVNFTSIDDSDPCTVDGCDQSTGNATHSAPDCNVKLSLSVFIQGFYTGNGLMDNSGNGGFLYVTNQPGAQPDHSDSINVEIRDPNPPYGLIEEQKVLLHTNGSALAVFTPAVVYGNPYHVVVEHWNSLPASTAQPIVLMPISQYSFTSASSQAFGNNLVATFDNAHYALYSGDINQDCAIDGSDFLDLDISIQNGDGGYIYKDLNGDGAVDGSDYNILDGNIQMGIGCP